MELPLDPKLSIGIQTLHRRTEPAQGPWLPRIDELVALVELLDRCGYDAVWVGDHIAFAVPILDPLQQLAQAAVVSRRLVLGTGVYLLPLRHPAPVAKQVATLDHLTEGRLICRPSPAPSRGSAGVISVFRALPEPVRSAGSGRQPAAPETSQRNR